MPSNQSDLIQPVATLTTKSAPVQCPHCNQFVYTVLDYDSGVCTGLSVAGLFMAGLHSGGCLLPFLFPWTKDVTHHCPACKEKIATFARLERDTRVHGNFFQQ
ncbi:Lipopolysaccharide-induced tumor necrosis factor-alpha factor [Choanephora cucurbitarum]|uniref:Lipopolysaccharide-induced tumor necrosis factor-alpha factor n=1 Tax=Choanephora cucurbitarum TaxID=101091 RepID=A0A1C7N479_9FUNG|nr:Lipopolysaccharide-induced tumor necrosis factor-alpha factor [Choanephora cucurbitarum]